MKRACTRCLRVKPLEEFYRNGCRHYILCKTCHKERVKQRDKNNWYSYIHRQARHRAKKRNIGFDITVHDLEQLWLLQGGKCKLSGVPLKPDIDADDLDTGSLDQIEASRGYTKDNIQFVSVWVNRAKTTLSVDSFYDRITATARFLEEGRRKDDDGK